MLRLLAMIDYCDNGSALYVCMYVALYVCMYVAAASSGVHGASGEFFNGGGGLATCGSNSSSSALIELYFI